MTVWCAMMAARNAVECQGRSNSDTLKHRLQPCRVSGLRDRGLPPDPTHSESAMSDRAVRIARAINSFVENPITDLVKGILLLLIGLSDASKSVLDDLAQRQFR